MAAIRISVFIFGAALKLEADSAALNSHMKYMRLNININRITVVNYMYMQVYSARQISFS